MRRDGLGAYSFVALVSFVVKSKHQHSAKVTSVLKLVIVSGLSGSGKSVALHTLEDLGYYCIDNLPTGLLSALAQELRQSERPIKRAVVGIDARNLPQALQRFDKHAASTP